MDVKDFKVEISAFQLLWKVKKNVGNGKIALFGPETINKD